MTTDLKAKYKQNYYSILELIDSTIGEVETLGLKKGKNDKYLYSSIKKVFKIEYGFYIHQNILYDLNNSEDVEALEEVIGEIETDRIINKYNS